MEQKKEGVTDDEGCTETFFSDKEEEIEIEILLGV